MLKFQILVLRNDTRHAYKHRIQNLPFDMKAILGVFLKEISRISLIACCLFGMTILQGGAQSIEGLQADLELLRQRPRFEKDTAYLEKANEFAFVLAETNPDSAFAFLEVHLKMCRAAKFKKGEAEALKIYGNALQNKGDFTASVEYYEKSLDIARAIPDNALIPGILNNIGLVYFNLGNYGEALVNFYEAIKGAEATDNLNVKAAALNNIAMIYFEQNKLEEAKSKYREMLAIYKEMGNQGRMILAYNNIGDVALKQNKPLEALETLKIGHASALALQSPEFIEMTARTLADIYAALDSTAKSESFYLQSIAIAKEKGYGVPLSHSTLGLAELYHESGDLDEAFALATEALEQAVKMGQIMQLRNANELLAKIKEEKGNFEGALEHFKLYKLYNDSINNTQGQRLAATLEAEYEFSKKSLEFEKASLRQRWLIFFACFGLLTFLVILFIVYRNRNNLNRAFHALKEKNIEVQSKNEKLEKALALLKETQLQLVQSEKMASLGELTAGIAHEIQNPLNFVNNFSEVCVELVEEIRQTRLKNKENNPAATGGDLEDEILEDIRQNLEKINHHGKRADGIVRGMLEHSRTSKGDKAPTNINALADEYLRLSYHGLRAKDKSFFAEFSAQLDPNLPKVDVVAQDIGRVLLNLINNAFYACSDRKRNLNKDPMLADEAGYLPKVTVSTWQENGKLVISVADNGSGIPEQIKDKIFQPFFTTKPTGQGTGLGLSLSYDIVKAHGGSLSVNSSAGSGTEFRVELPL
jgi:signal transduction histidine kinase